MIDTSKYPYYLEHSCGKPVFYINHKPLMGELMDADDFIYPDGTKPSDGDEGICRSCGGSLNDLELNPDLVKHV